MADEILALAPEASLLLQRMQKATVSNESADNAYTTERLSSFTTQISFVRILRVWISPLYLLNIKKTARTSPVP